MNPHLVLPRLDFESSASAISPLRLKKDLSIIPLRKKSILKGSILKKNLACFVFLRKIIFLALLEAFRIGTEDLKGDLTGDLKGD